MHTLFAALFAIAAGSASPARIPMGPHTSARPIALTSGFDAITPETVNAEPTDDQFASDEGPVVGSALTDRKSTRLNSSHTDRSEERRVEIGRAHV